MMDLRIASTRPVARELDAAFEPAGSQNATRCLGTRCWESQDAIRCRGAPSSGSLGLQSIVLELTVRGVPMKGFVVMKLIFGDVPAEIRIFGGPSSATL